MPDINHSNSWLGLVHYGYSPNNRRWPNVGLMLANRLRRCPNISRTLGKRLMFAGYIVTKATPRRRWSNAGEIMRTIWPISPRLGISATVSSWASGHWHVVRLYQPNTIHWTNVGLMLGLRRNTSQTSPLTRTAVKTDMNISCQTMNLVTKIYW